MQRNLRNIGGHDALPSPIRHLGGRVPPAPREIYTTGQETSCLAELFCSEESAAILWLHGAARNAFIHNRWISCLPIVDRLVWFHWSTFDSGLDSI